MADGLGNQFGRLGLVVRPHQGSTPPLDPATIAWRNAVIAAGGTVTPGRANTVNTLIVGLKSDNIFSIFDRLWLLAAENPQSALVDIIAANTSAVLNLTPTFVIDRGYTGNGSNFNINTNWLPTPTGVNYTQNSAHVSCWNLTNAASNDPQVTIEGIGDPNIYPQFTDTNSYLRVNDNPSTGGFGPPGADCRGLLLGNRDSSSTRQAYQNGASSNTYGASTSAALANAHLLLAFNNQQCAAASVGGSFSAANQLKFYNRLLAYMVAIGAAAVAALLLENSSFLLLENGSKLLL